MVYLEVRVDKVKHSGEVDMVYNGVEFELGRVFEDQFQVLTSDGEQRRDFTHV